MLPPLRAKLRFFPASAFFAENLFSDLPPQALETLARIKHKKEFQKGIFIAARGIVPSRFYVLQAGQARVNGETGFRNSFRSGMQGEIFGLTEALAKMPYRISVETVTSCSCEFIEQDDFIEFLLSEREACFRLAQILGARLQKNQQLFRLSCG